jgi:ATP/maltotriose-dependent transcriptional regulator MalT
MLDELLLENPEPRMLVPILIQQSVAWRSLGSPVAAHAFVESAATYARPDAPKQQGWVQHQRAQLFLERHEYAAAAKCLALAVQHYKRGKSPHDEAKALLSMTRLALERGDANSALAAARRAERFAMKHKFNRIRLCALVDQARALAAKGSIDESRTLLRSVLADPMVTDDNALSFYAHVYLWRLERASGNAARAFIELQEARYYLKYVDQDSPESRLVREELSGVSQAASSLEGSGKRRERVRSAAVVDAPKSMKSRRR